MLKKKYFFGIDHQEVGPLKEEAIKQKIVEGKITEETLVWCKGMEEWQVLDDVAELKEVFGPLLEDYIKPPPLPKTPPPKPVPPPLPKRSDSRGSSSRSKEAPVKTDPKAGDEPAGLSPLNAAAYRFVMWGYRPWKGGTSFIQNYVQKNPKTAVWVAGSSLLLLLLAFGLTLTVISASLEQANLSVPSQPAYQPPAPAQDNGDWRQRYQIWQQQQQDTQRILDDAYRYRRDSEDRRDETYRRENYEGDTDRND
ncbi:MAG TPA: DUF4339 domain-containing protein [Candidatus Omnitrophota bacterium]|nr:DUF4339 domain-containing protein [Candidatus Omnitrophota bacterium]HQO57128.1 DUF4339 domain-containing protein [Candidatus Omnitrophota bacterium]HQP11379.1 DUF4339 domain-containing protein [Candidatus Omnitrophota bacterium]